MRILAIETSCDESSVALLQASTQDGRTSFVVEGVETHSQIDLHQAYGGVYPSLAKREHAKRLPHLLAKLCTSTKSTKSLPFDSIVVADIAKILEREPDALPAFIQFITTHERPSIDYIAVTNGPGLEPALWVGIAIAKALARVWAVPVVPIDHMEGHILSICVTHQENETQLSPVEEIRFPLLSLLISGGHTELVISESWRSYKKIGQTRDDAVGEAYDKVARMLGLPYPGGPQIALLAEQERALSPLPQKSIIDLPRPMRYTPDCDFSFSGLKTAVLYATQKMTPDDLLSARPAIAREFEDAVKDVLVAKVTRAMQTYTPRSSIVAGGVASNQFLRDHLQQVALAHGATMFFPTKQLATDNALMIAVTAFFAIQDGKKVYAYDSETCTSPEAIRANGGQVFQ